MTPIPTAPATARLEQRMKPAEVHSRIVHARTPSIATDDTLTVAKLHDVVVEYVLALDAWAATGEGAEEGRLDRAERALRTVAGIEGHLDRLEARSNGV